MEQLYCHTYMGFVEAVLKTPKGSYILLAVHNEVLVCTSNISSVIGFIF